MEITPTHVNPATLDLEDQPLDKENVKLIKGQIMAWGCITNPVEVWINGNRIIDGLHRTKAALELGLPTIPIALYDCTEEQFWDKRIAQAKKHHVVEDDRLKVWMLESWRTSEFASNERNQEFIDTILLVHRSLTGGKQKADPKLTDWFKEKSLKWGKRPLDVVTMILEKEQIALPGAPELMKIGEELDLSVKQQKSLNAQVKGKINKPFGQGMSKKESRQFASDVIKNNLDTPVDVWRKQQKEKEERERQRQKARSETPSGLEDARRRRIENGVAAVDALRSLHYRLGDLLRIDVSELLLERPDLLKPIMEFLKRSEELGEIVRTKVDIDAVNSALRMKEESRKQKVTTRPFVNIDSLAIPSSVIDMMSN